MVHDEGLSETIDDISPIEDYTGTLAVEFGEYRFDESQFSIKECREKDLTFEAPAVDAGPVRQPGHGRDPRARRSSWAISRMMTEQGTFIINGTERVIVTQLVRCPGAYLMEPKDPTKQVFTANLMPSRGSWLELEIDKKGIVYARIDRKRKLPITTLLRALPQATVSRARSDIFQSLPRRALARLPARRDDRREHPRALRELGLSCATRSRRTPTTREEEAVIEVFKKQRPGEPPTLENARNLLRGLFFDPKRYDLTSVGRYKLNQRLEVDVPDDVRVLTPIDILALTRRLVDMPTKLGVPEDTKDFAADAAVLPRAPIAKELDEYEHFGNRRLRTVGELIQEAFRVGLYRMERVVRERMTTEDVDTITPQTIINIRPVHGGAQGVLRLLAAVAVHGSDELARRPHAPPPPLGARRRRADARARTDRGARRPPDALRPHVPDRDARRPEHRSDRLARRLCHRLGVRLHRDAVPRGQERQGHRRDPLPGRQRGGEVHDRRRPTSRSTRRPASSCTTRCCAGRAQGSSSRRRRSTSTTSTSIRRSSCLSRRR